MEYEVFKITSYAQFYLTFFIYVFLISLDSLYSYQYNMNYLNPIKIKNVNQYFCFWRMKLFFVDLNEEMYKCMIKYTL